MKTKRVRVYTVTGWVDAVERTYDDGRVDYADMCGNVIAVVTEVAEWHAE